jgi:hypothetical protein
MYACISEVFVVAAYIHERNNLASKQIRVYLHSMLVAAEKHVVCADRLDARKFKGIRPRNIFTYFYIYIIMRKHAYACEYVRSSSVFQPRNIFNHFHIYIIMRKHAYTCKNSYTKHAYIHTLKQKHRNPKANWPWNLLKNSEYSSVSTGTHTLLQRRARYSSNSSFYTCVPTP